MTRWIAPVSLLLLVAACDRLGPVAAKFIPPLESMNEEWAAKQMDCEPPIATPRTRNCVIGRIACGDTVEGHSAAGKKRYNDRFWTGAKCTPRRMDYELAPEVTYKLRLPPNTEATVELIADCGDLDLFAFRWEHKTSCPSNLHYDRILECEMDTTPRGGRVKLTSIGKDINYLVGVDGKKGATGNYRISVQCRNYR
jgi:hypothetical protein